MKTSYLYLTMSIILVFGAVSIGSQGSGREVRESSIQYELKLSSDIKNGEQEIIPEFEEDSFKEQSLDLEAWMTDLNDWK
ncbi:MAG: hypothetical protein K9H49_09580 [Bacteroidales bacterium]|nr:hypothetical protein [Bacteroidales bacterium]MCF8389905.1 hypothetical protein [Bacteroidales bacterium]